MYLEKVFFINRAPFEHLEINFKENGINILTAINGKGKTTILSYIVDAFHEMSRPYFSSSYKGKENDFYRVSSPLSVINSTKTSIVYFRFLDNDSAYDYLDIQGYEVSEDEYNKIIYLKDKIPFSSFIDRLKGEHLAKVFSENANEKSVKSFFENNLLTYFPAYRYEMPAYLNEIYKNDLKFKTENTYNGYLHNPIEVISDLNNFSNWLLDVILDWQVNKQTQQIYNQENKSIFYDITPENILFQQLNILLNAILSGKKLKELRFGIGRRSDSGQRISVMSVKEDKQLIPNISFMSSGELALLCLFGEIIRQGDNLVTNIELSNITGIVLIDEIDKHLHITLQKEILPKLLNLFPKTQFIITSHSPFFNMGLAESSMERTQITDLDHDGITCEPMNNELYREVYNMMINENKRFADKYEELNRKIQNITKPLIITEGKTDIMHILKAKKKLNITNLDFETIESDKQPNGESDLEKMLSELSKTKRANVIIGIFDRDQDGTIKKIEDGKQLFKDYGNKVYAFCIPVPKSRVDKNQIKISIEYLYSDEEIKNMLPNGCRLFFGTEFSQKTGRHNEYNEWSLSMPDGRGVDKILENNGKQAVFSSDGNNHLAKKSDFADAIVNSKIEIDPKSWENFRPIFNTISAIINSTNRNIE